MSQDSDTSQERTLKIGTIKCVCVRNRAKYLREAHQLSYLEICPATGATIRVQPPPLRLAVCGVCGTNGLPVLEEMLFTQQEIDQIIQDTTKLAIRRKQLRDEAKARKERKNQAEEAIKSQLQPAEKKEEIVVSHQVLREKMPDRFESNTHKWRHMPFSELRKIFEYVGQWNVRRVCRRWYDAFMNQHLEISIPTDRLFRTVILSNDLEEHLNQGWSDEHNSFWKKQIECHKPLLLEEKPVISRAIRHSDEYLETLYDAILASRNLVLWSHLMTTFASSVCECGRPSYTKEKCSLELARQVKAYYVGISRMHAEIGAFDLFVSRYSHLIETFGITRAMSERKQKLDERKAERQRIMNGLTQAE